jgi:hypothetical protein
MFCVAAAAACVHTVNTKSRLPSVQDLVDQQIALHDGLPWSSTRALTWVDYKGRVPAADTDGAHTAYSLFSAGRCVRRSFDFRVTAAVLPAQSWVKPTVVADRTRSRNTLRHEQTHFDLTEVYARRMRQYFGELYEPCLKSEVELDALAQKFVQQESDAQKLYDQETNHGLLAAKQTAWNNEVAKELESLAKYTSGTTEPR